MICTECGKETPDDSAFCECCGHAIASAKDLAAASFAEVVEGTAASGALDDVRHADAANGHESEASDANSAPRDIADAEASDADDVVDVDSELSIDDDAQFAPIDLYSRLKNLDVSTMERPSDEDEFVFPASVPLQPRLGRARTIAIAVVGTLFGAALILLFCIAVMRLLGL